MRAGTRHRRWRFQARYRDGARIVGHPDKPVPLQRPIRGEPCLTWNLLIRGHRGPGEVKFNSTHIHGTHVPVEEPSTASEADLTRGVRSRLRCRSAATPSQLDSTTNWIKVEGGPEAEMDL
jgi:hypothetical protein